MKSYKTIIAMSVAGLACTGMANAALITGGFAAAGDPLITGGSYTSSSLTMNADNLITGTPTLPGISTLSDLTANSSTITGLSTTAKTLDITDFLVFSSTDGSFGGGGTTPSDRYTFTLTSLTETTYSGVNGADFYGTGTLIDTTGALQDTDASFTVGFSGEGSYSFTFAAASPVPEPTTIAAGALLLLPFGIGAIRSIRKARA